MTTLELSYCKKGQKNPNQETGFESCGCLKVLMIGPKWAWVTPLIIYDQFGTIQHLQMSPFQTSSMVGTFLPFLTARRLSRKNNQNPFLNFWIIITISLHCAIRVIQGKKEQEGAVKIGCPSVKDNQKTNHFMFL